ncbi:MAG TPA: DUF2059 domain-containing protein [Pyrinomonadaceae bacterium]|jgi:hypothetical protein
MFARKLMGFMFCLSLTCGGVVVVQAQDVRDADKPAAISPERRADIGRLLELMNVFEEEKNSVEPLFENFKRAAPHVPAEVWRDLRKEFDAEFTKEFLLNSYLPIYARRFSAAEVKEFIKFFDSPAGRKMIATLPLIREEAFAIGYERGRKLGERIREKLRARGYSLSET